MASTNGMESVLAMLRRGHDGVFHHFSEKHLDRYVAEFSGRHNMREADTAAIMAAVAPPERWQAPAVSAVDRMSKPSPAHEIIDHPIAGQVVRQRTRDTYIDARALCEAAGKSFDEYTRWNGKFLAALSAQMEILRVGQVRESLPNP